MRCEATLQVDTCAASIKGQALAVNTVLHALVPLPQTCEQRVMMTAQPPETRRGPVLAVATRTSHRLGHAEADGRRADLEVQVWNNHSIDKQLLTAATENTDPRHTVRGL